MRAITMCFTILQVPRCRIQTFSNLWRQSFCGLNRTHVTSSSFRLVGSSAKSLEGGYSRRWIKRPVSTKPEGRNKTTRNSKTTTIRHEILDETVPTSATLNVNKTEVTEFQKVEYYDIQQKIAENGDLAKPVTVVVFDIETSGFSRENDSIIEIALQDLQGGENSTFQSLVNPGRFVPNSHVHGITTRMVCRPDVPSMEELIPILLKYVRSRQKPGGYVLFVAHNARTFDVPFLAKEFARCSVDVPSNWLFLDTIPLARELIKSEGSKLPSKISLQALREKFDIPSVGSAHRAMSDVRVLALVLQRLTFSLKLTLTSLVEKSFTASDLISVKKKNSN